MLIRQLADVIQLFLVRLELIKTHENFIDKLTMYVFSDFSNYILTKTPRICHEAISP